MQKVQTILTMVTVTVLGLLTLFLAGILTLDEVVLRTLSVPTGLIFFGLLYYISSQVNVD